MINSQQLNPTILIPGYQRRTVFLLLLSAIFLWTISCDQFLLERNPSTVEGDWLIPKDKIFDGGPGKDGIPSIDNPVFAPVDEIDFLRDDRLVNAMKIGDEVRAYPHQVLDWHEIVNDKFNEKPVALIWCPLTGTATGWNRKIDGEVTEFGVSGLIFKNNVIPFDRNSDSNWSQMRLRSVNGQLAGRNAELVPVVETTWETWKETYPDSRVLTDDTGFSRDYKGFAYGIGYTSDHNAVIFPRDNIDERLQNKVRVHGIIDDKTVTSTSPVKVYVISNFGRGVNLVRTTVGDNEYIVAGSSDKNFAVAYESTLPDGTQPEFETISGELPVILSDEEGNLWDLFGIAVEGPRAGQRLTPALAYTGYWFAWADFFPFANIHGFEEMDDPEDPDLPENP